MVCVSCRPDGKVQITRGFPLVQRTGEVFDALYSKRFLTVDGNGDPVVYFTSFNALAPGATAGLANIYEWSHGRHLSDYVRTSGINDVGLNAEGTAEIGFGDAGPDGSDLYVVTPEALNSENGEERWAVYDARVGGGFPEPRTASGLQSRRRRVVPVVCWVHLAASASGQLEVHRTRQSGELREDAAQEGWQVRGRRSPVERRTAKKRAAKDARQKDARQKTARQRWR